MRGGGALHPETETGLQPVETLHSTLEVPIGALKGSLNFNGTFQGSLGPFGIMSPESSPPGARVGLWPHSWAAGRQRHRDPKSANMGLGFGRV